MYTSDACVCEISKTKNVKNERNIRSIRSSQLDLEYTRLLLEFTMGESNKIKSLTVGSLLPPRSEYGVVFVICFFFRPTPGGGVVYEVSLDDKSIHTTYKVPIVETCNCTKLPW